MQNLYIHFLWSLIFKCTYYIHFSYIYKIVMVLPRPLNFANLYFIYVQILSSILQCKFKQSFVFDLVKIIVNFLAQSLISSVSPSANTRIFLTFPELFEELLSYQRSQNFIQIHYQNFTNQIYWILLHNHWLFWFHQSYYSITITITTCYFDCIKWVFFVVKLLLWLVCTSFNSKTRHMLRVFFFFFC